MAQPRNSEYAGYKARKAEAATRMIATVDVDAILDMFKFIGAQSPYVISRGINETLVGAQKRQYDWMRTTYTIRNEAFLKYSVRVQFAKPKPVGGIISGRVYVADLPGKATTDIWNTFETGGTKTPKKSKNIAVPTNDAWPNRNRIKPERNKPRNLTDSFAIKKGTNTFIVARKGKKSKIDGSGRDRNLKLMYVLKDSVPIPRNLYFYHNTMEYIKRNGSGIMSKELNRTIYLSQLRNQRKAGLMGPLPKMGNVRVEI